jgi:hypothetical protein
MEEGELEMDEDNDGDGEEGRRVEAVHLRLLRLLRRPHHFNCKQIKLHYYK